MEEFPIHYSVKLARTAVVKIGKKIGNASFADGVKNREKQYNNGK